MMRTFNEWLTKRADFDELSPVNNLGFLTREDEELVVNQLGLFIDRIMGVLHYVPQEKRGKLVEKFISDLQNQVRD